MANSVDPDEMLHSVGLHCLPRPVCQNPYGKSSRQHMVHSFEKPTLKEKNLIANSFLLLEAPFHKRQCAGKHTGSH